MPMKSEAQRRYLWLHEPEVAKKFEAKTPADAQLPEHVADTEAGHRRAVYAELRRRRKQK